MPLRVGDRIGKITLVEKTAERVKHGRNHRVVWRCLCTCGVELLRTDTSLYNSYKNGTAACPNCRKGRAGSAASAAYAREKGKERLQRIQRLRYWDEFRSLYTERECIQQELDTWKKLIAEFGPLRNPMLVELGLGRFPATMDYPSPSTATAEFYDGELVRYS